MDKHSPVIGNLLQVIRIDTEKAQPAVDSGIGFTRSFAGLPCLFSPLSACFTIPFPVQQSVAINGGQFVHGTGAAVPRCPGEPVKGSIPVGRDAEALVIRPAQQILRISVPLFSAHDVILDGPVLVLFDTVALRVEKTDSGI